MSKRSYKAMCTERKTNWVVYKIEFGADIDGTGAERWRSEELARFNTEAAAESFLNTYDDYAEIIEQDY